MNDRQTLLNTAAGTVCPQAWVAELSAREMLLARGAAAAPEVCLADALAQDETPATRYVLAAALADRGELTAAAEQLRAAWDRARSLGSAGWRARCCHALAEVHRRAGDHDLSNRYRQWALRAELEDRGEIDPAPWLQDRAAEALVRGELDAALSWLNAAGRTLTDSGREEGVMHLNAGLLALRSGSGPSALCQFARAFHAFRRMGELSGCAQAALSLGQAWQAGGDWRRARSAFLYAARLFLKLGARQDAHFAEARAAECRRLEAAWCWDPRRN